MAFNDGFGGDTGRGPFGNETPGIGMNGPVSEDYGLGNILDLTKKELVIR